MSDVRRSPNRRDLGMTLPEVLISMVVVGAIVAVLATSVSVTLRNQSSTEGRLNVARAEQNISLWVPADLASAAEVSTEPSMHACSTNCPAGVDPTAGSNALLLRWNVATPDGGSMETVVSYLFAPAGDGSYVLVRIECVNGVCSSNRVLSGLAGPPGGDPFVPGETKPTWVIMVSEPLAPDAVNDGQLASPDSPFRNARRVIVTIDGGGMSVGAGGGVNQISITAGGTDRTEIAADSLQGAPSFVEARSRCGGSLTLIVDESNSITNANIGQIRNGVREFIEVLAGTPVRLQVVRFHTRASILGSDQWTRYFDLREPAEVDALLGVVNQLQGSWPFNSQRNGGTNWEDALFRTFYTPTGQIQQHLPDTMVFFTDGVPTYSRLDDPLYPVTVTRGAPGVLPAEPAAPGAPWPLASGTAYNQVSFNRANHIATRFRSTVRMIGVGVGPDISLSSPWMVDPGAGYHLTWERGSRSHQRATSFTTQSMWQVRHGWSWSNTTEQAYNAHGGTKRIQWGTISTSVFNANNTTADDSDGYRRINLGNWTWVSTSEFEAHSAGPNGDIYRAVAKEWSNGPDWEPWVGDRPGSSSHYRSTKVYAPPHEAFDPAVTTTTPNSVIIARLIAGNDTGVPALWNGSTYTNAEVADMYISPNWAQFTHALQAVALGECGGTVTLQTRRNGAPVPDPFVYQNTAAIDSTGVPLGLEPTVVQTGLQYTSGTFDFPVGDGTYVDVDIVPQNLSDLVGYVPVGWTCRAGVTARPVTTVPISDSVWSGVRVRVAANEAVSCTLSVDR